MGIEGGAGLLDHERKTVLFSEEERHLQNQYHSGHSVPGTIGFLDPAHILISASPAGEASAIAPAKSMLHRARMLPSWKYFIVDERRI